jgi:hypothetical protein
LAAIAAHENGAAAHQTISGRRALSRLEMAGQPPPGEAELLMAADNDVNDNKL